MSNNDLELISDNGEKIRIHYQEPFVLGRCLLDPYLMIFCHGFPNENMSSHDDLFRKLQNACARIGVHSVMFDFRGCGTSDGNSEDFTMASATEDLETIKEWANNRGFEKFMITGAGLGAVPAILGDDQNILAGAFFWPVLQTQDYAIRNLEAEEHKSHFDMGGFIELHHGKVGIPLIKELYHMDIIDDLNRIKYPCLLQQGADDTVIPIEHLELAKAHLRNKRIEITSYQDGTYGLPQDNHRKHMIYHYEQFILKYL